MELQGKYHIFLDHKGYICEEGTYRVTPAPIMGTKFSTGRSAYSGLDFWQVGAVTDYIHGMNQKFMSDPSMCYYAEGLNLSKPGQLQLENDLETFSGLPGGITNVTAHYRALDTLYIGTDAGKIYKTTDGSTFSLEYDTGTGTKVYSFYEINGDLFAAMGTKNIYAKHSGTWSKIGISTEFPARKDDFDSGSGATISGTTKYYQTFQAPMGGETFHTLQLKLRYLAGVPNDDLRVTIQEESTTTKGEPDGTAKATFTFSKLSVTDTYAWMSCTISNFSLKAGITYFLVAESSGSTGAGEWLWMHASGSKATYEYGNEGRYSGSAWTDLPDRNLFFTLKRDTITNLYYVMVDSDYAFGWFDDGIRRSIDGFNWTPEPPDPLWVMPSGEGVTLNAVSTPKGFISGSQRGLWSFIGGSSGYNLWQFPDYTSTDNFKGMDKWAHLCIFSVENQGIYYTDGSQIYPSMLTYLEEGFKFKSCKAIYSSGWDIYAVVSNDGSNWYLARSNMNYNPVPKYWWIVKKLSKTPVHMAGWNDSKIYVFYSDNTCEFLNKNGTTYVSSGFMRTSIMDENLVKIMKLYYNLSIIYDTFPQYTTSSIGYRLKITDSFTTKSFTGAATETVESVYKLANPTLGNKIQVQVTLENTTGHRNVTPIVTDVTWKYILQRPSEDTTIKNAYSFMVKGLDYVENLLGDTQEIGRSVPRLRLDILSDLRATAAKKQVLNYIGADNKSEVGIIANYTGTGSSCIMTIDRTNYTISTSVTGAPADNQTYNYEGKTLADVITAISGWSNYTATKHQDQLSTRTAHDLEPRNDIELKGERYLMVGSDVHAVILSDQSPGQSKRTMDGRGEDSYSVSLREA